MKFREYCESTIALPNLKGITDRQVMIQQIEDIAKSSKAYMMSNLKMPVEIKEFRQIPVPEAPSLYDRIFVSAIAKTPEGYSLYLALELESMKPWRDGEGWNFTASVKWGWLPSKYWTQIKGGKSIRTASSWYNLRKQSKLKRFYEESSSYEGKSTSGVNLTKFLNLAIKEFSWAYDYTTRVP